MDDEVTLASEPRVYTAAPNFITCGDQARARCARLLACVYHLTKSFVYVKVYKPRARPVLNERPHGGTTAPFAVSTPTDAVVLQPRDAGRMVCAAVNAH